MFDPTNGLLAFEGNDKEATPGSAPLGPNDIVSDLSQFR